MGGIGRDVELALREGGREGRSVCVYVGVCLHELVHLCLYLYVYVCVSSSVSHFVCVYLQVSCVGVHHFVFV